MKLYLALISILLLVGCDNSNGGNNEKFEKSKLIGEIYSYSRINEIKSKLNGSQGKWEVTERSKEVIERDQIDPIFLSVRVKEYQHLGYRGILDLQFFRGRLMSTVFSPNDFAGYLRALSESLPDIKLSDNYVFISKYTRIWLSHDLQKEKFVGWSDIRLDDKHIAWLKRAD